MKKRSRTKSNRKKSIYLATMFMFIAVILVLVLVMLLTSDKTFSDRENRVLAQMPSFSLASAADGSFMTDAEDYVADQFAFRNSWITIKLNIDRLLGKNESNGVYIGSSSQLFEIPDEPDSEEVSKNLEAISSFAARHAGINTYVSLVPTACAVLTDKLPSNAPLHDELGDIAADQAALSTATTFIDVTENLKAHSEEYIYYRNDHHWTSLGARYAFETIAPYMGIDVSTAQYTTYTVADSFYGTLSSKCGLYDKADSVDIYVNTADYDYVVNYVDEGRKTASIYDSSKLDQRDKYEVFFGGNTSRIDIETTTSNSRSLLIIKDSYANCFVQFLLPYFQNITIVDPRYYSDNIDNLISNNSVTDILFLYNINTFNGDRYIADVLNLQ